MAGETVQEPSHAPARSRVYFASRVPWRGGIVTLIALVLCSTVVWHNHGVLSVYLLSRAIVRCDTDGAALAIRSGAVPAQVGRLPVVLRLFNMLVGGDHRIQCDDPYPDLLWDVKGNEPSRRRSIHRMLQLLLEHGADPNVWDAAGATPLMLASLCGDSESVELLIRRGAALNCKDVTGCTALHCCSVTNKASIASLLCHSGANVDALDDMGQTPLMLAARHNSVEVAASLLEAGADVCLKDRHGETAADIARLADEPRVSALINIAARRARVGSPRNRPLAQ